MDGLTHGPPGQDAGSGQVPEPPAFAVPAAFPAWIQPPGGRWWTPEGRKAKKGPTFGVQEVAKIFFARSGSWLRMRMQPTHSHPNGWFTEDGGSPMEFIRVKGNVKNYSYRRFTLHDVERMLWSYYLHEARERSEWYLSLDRTGRRGDMRMERYQAQMTEATYRLMTGIEIVKSIGRQYAIVAPPATQATGTTVSEWRQP